MYVQTAVQAAASLYSKWTRNMFGLHRFPLFILYFRFSIIVEALNRYEFVLVARPMTRCQVADGTSDGFYCCTSRLYFFCDEKKKILSKQQSILLETAA